MTPEELVDKLRKGARFLVLSNKTNRERELDNCENCIKNNKGRCCVANILTPTYPSEKHPRCVGGVIIWHNRNGIHGCVYKPEEIKVLE